MTLNRELSSPWWAPRIGLGLGPFLAGLDKFLKDTKKKDHLRVTVDGERRGDSITVTSVSLN